MPTAKTPKLELVDIDSLEAHSENPNQGDVGAIVDLIVHNGWFGQTLVQTRDDQPDRIFVGEHRWRALRLLQSQGGVVRENGTDTPLDYPALQARAEALDELLRDLNADPEIFPPTPENTAGKAQEVVCPQCGHEFVPTAKPSALVD